MAGVTDADADTGSPVVREDASAFEAAAALTVGLAAVLFGLALASLVEVVSIDGAVAGVPTVPLLGALLLVMGAAVVAFGLASRRGVFPTEPRPSAGVVAATVFSGIWFVVGGLVAAHTLGLPLVGYLPLAVLTGGVAFVVTALPREDVGSTLPAGALAILAGTVLVTDVIGPGWAWGPAGFPSSQSVTFVGEIVVPAIVLFCTLVVGWSAAKAYGGFGARGRHLGAYLLIYLNAGSIIAVLAVLVAFVVYKGLGPATSGLELGLNAGPETTLALGGLGYTIVWPLDVPFVMRGTTLLNDVNGVFPAVVGTFWLVAGAVVMAVPLGVGAAVFLTEYAERGRFTQVVEIATNALWSTPSIVFGLFGLAFLVPRFTADPSKSLLSGMITLGFMLLPLVVITSREAIIAVPDEYRDASAALGVSKWDTIRSVVLPAAMPGVVTGVILGVGRIAGETAPILLTIGGATAPAGSDAVDVVGGFEFTATPPFVTNPELTRATTALPYQLYQLMLTGTGETSGIADITTFKWGTALVLLAVVLSFYAVGILTRQYFRRKLKHE